MALLLACLVAAPMMHYAATQPRQFAERARETLILSATIGGVQSPESVPRTLLAFHDRRRQLSRHNLPFLAPLLWFAVVLLGGCLQLGQSVFRTGGGFATRCCRSGSASRWCPAQSRRGPHACGCSTRSFRWRCWIGVAAGSLPLCRLQAALPRPLWRVLAGWLLAAPLRSCLNIAPTSSSRAAFEFVGRVRTWELMPGRYLAAHAPTGDGFLDPITY
mgnify:CR=1 FL=1